MSPIYPGISDVVFMYAAHDLPNSHKNLRNVLPVAVDIVVVLSAGASASDVASRPQAGRLAGD
jgi:hypothetical protein